MLCVSADLQWIWSVLDVYKCKSVIFFLGLCFFSAQFSHIRFLHLHSLRLIMLRRGVDAAGDKRDSHDNTQPHKAKINRFLCCKFGSLFLIILVTTSKMYRTFSSKNPCATLHSHNYIDPHNIPKIIHQQARSLNQVTTFSKQWQDRYPDHRYILWDDASARELIESKFSFFLQTYDSYPMNIQRVDASRYFILYHFGGVYADLDYEILTNDLWYYLPTNKVGLVESPYLYNELVQNSFMSSPVNSEFWPLVFDTLERNKHR